MATATATTSPPTNAQTSSAAQAPAVSNNGDGFHAQLEFDTTSVVEVPIRIDGHPHLLREANALAIEQYQIKMQQGSRADKDGRVQLGEGVVVAESFLVAQCLYRCDKDGRLPLNGSGDPDHRSLVPISTIHRWKYAIKKALYAECLRICGINDDVESLKRQRDLMNERIEALESKAGEGQAKNLPNGSTSGSA